MTQKYKINIEDIVDTNGDKITASEINRFFGIDDLYEYCQVLKSAIRQISDKSIQSDLATLISRIKVSYYYKILREGGGLDPISLKDNILVDGRRRLWARILNGETEVEYVK